MGIVCACVRVCRGRVRISNWAFLTDHYICSKKGTSFRYSNPYIFVFYLFVFNGIYLKTNIHMAAQRLNCMEFTK